MFTFLSSSIIYYFRLDEIRLDETNTWFYSLEFPSRFGLSFQSRGEELVRSLYRFEIFIVCIPVQRFKYLITKDFGQVWMKMHACD